MTTFDDDINDIPRYFRRQPRMRYHFNDDLRMGVIGGDEESLMRFGAHLQSCPDCETRQFALIERLSSLATSSPAGSIAAVTTPSQQPPPERMANPRSTIDDQMLTPACATTRSAYFQFLEQDREIDREALFHLLTCDVCRAHLTDAALTRYTIEVHGEEELPAIG